MGGTSPGAANGPVVWCTTKNVHYEPVCKKMTH